MQTANVKSKPRCNRKRAAFDRLALHLFVACLTTAACTSDASALEDVVPYLPGVSIGVPVGALPPPGLYYSNPDNTFDLQVKNGQGKDIGVHVQDTQVINQFVYVPAIPQILGATYGILVAQPLRFSYLGTPASEKTASGIVNTVVSPLNLSWKIGDGLFFSLGLTAYVPDSDYHLQDPIHLGRNYFTTEPNFGISYLKNGWNFTLHPVVDFNTVNPANGYKSGSVLAVDYTASRAFGKFKLGVGGTWISQFTNDTVNGLVVAASPFNGYGNRAQNFTVGPVASYNFDDFTLTAYYNRSVYARSTAAGDNYWLRFDVPLYSAAPARAAKTDAGGPR